MFKREYKTRVKIKRFGYVDGRYRRITEFDYQEFLNMGFTKKVFDKPNINGWNEAIFNSNGSTVTFKIISD